MRILIENVGLIEKADIALDGITVIAGENNTGKSTVGRVLFTTLRNMNSWKQRYKELCADNLSKVVGKESIKLEEFCLSNTAAVRRRSNRANELLRRLCHDDDFLIAVEDFQVTRMSDEKEYKEAYQLVQWKVDGYCREYISLYQKGDISDLLKREEVYLAKWCEDVVLALRNNVQMDEAVLQAREYKTTFSNNFDGQVIKEGEDKCRIQFQDGDDIRTLSMSDLGEKLDSPVRVDFGVHFIESPKVFDEIGTWRFPPFFVQDELNQLLVPNVFNRRIMHRFNFPVKQYLEEKDDETFNTPNDVQGVVEMLRNAMHGRCEYNIKEGIRFKEDGLKKTISPQNVSTGVKSMAILEYAVRVGMLRPNDVLILDEPEINLHPEWQVVYAKALVLLQKAYNLKVLLTTHSPYFLRAIECFMDVYKRMDLLNVYFMSRDSHGKHCIQDVMRSEYGMTELYEKLSAPFDQLQDMINQEYGYTEGVADDEDRGTSGREEA